MPDSKAGILETSITKAIIMALKRLQKIWVVKTHGGLMQAAGLPDIIGCYRGRFFALEVKRPGNKPTLLQQFVMDQIVHAGGIAEVVYSVDDALRAINAMDIVYCDRMGHLIIDGDVGILHTFAEGIGLKREWFQEKGWKSHYDLTSDRMILKAIEKGARLIDPRELVKILEAKR